MIMRLALALVVAALFTGCAGLEEFVLNRGPLDFGDANAVVDSDVFDLEGPIATKFFMAALKGGMRVPVYCVGAAWRVCAELTINTPIAIDAAAWRQAKEPVPGEPPGRTVRNPSEIPPAEIKAEPASLVYLEVWRLHRRRG